MTYEEREAQWLERMTKHLAGLVEGLLVPWRAGTPMDYGFTILPAYDALERHGEALKSELKALGWDVEPYIDLSKY